MIEKQLLEILGISSATHKEKNICTHISKWLESQFPDSTIHIHRDSIICRLPFSKGKPHVALVGHSDTIPEFFEPYESDGKIFGSGASDMKGAMACYLTLLQEKYENLLESANVSLIIYSREEGTPLEDNGLHDLIEYFPSYFKSIDLAIVGEPTDNNIQIGCMGSIHCEVTVKGLACHSARPWDGENALYKAIPFIQKMSEIQPVKKNIFGVDFFDVMQITQSESEKGRTSLPGFWKANVNFRFAPDKNLDQAIFQLKETLKSIGVTDENMRLVDQVPSGTVIETDLFARIVKALDRPIQAKQAWTDVAQLTGMGIPSFNFGPGLTTQAHKKDEYVTVDNLNDYYQRLVNLFDPKSKTNWL